MGLASAGPAAASRLDVILSNETTHTTWAVADYATPIRVQPSASASQVAKFQFLTPDQFLQSYVLLRERRTPSGSWVLLRIPGRPNGRTGWAPRGSLDAFNRVNTQLVVNRASRRLSLYRAGRLIYQAPVGVGKPSTPTPAGHFWITESFGGFNSPAYGPWAFGTSDFSSLTDWPGGGIVGMHGTNEPQLVPGDPSHGCIRLHNSDVLRLKSLVPLGTPMLVQ